MGLSFTPEMQVTLPEYLYGTERFKNINKLINFNKKWREEAYDQLRIILAKMKEFDASDMDIGGEGAQGKVWFRIFGNKGPRDDVPTYSEDEITAILLSILSDEQKVVLFKQKNVDFSLGLLFDGDKNSSRFRGDVYFENNNLVANFRRINQYLFPMESLGFPPAIVKKLNVKHEKSGLILITGITGAGKSCSLDSIVDMNNKSYQGHIVIIGNPIEYIHKSHNSIIRHREVGGDVLGFKDGAIQALRQDPDVIVVGEMRDSKTIATVLEVTDSGHKVFTTLHTSSAIESLHRIIGEFPSEEQDRVRMRLADCLSLVISQKLIPDTQGKLTLAKEILNVTSSVKAAIRNKNISEIYQMIMQGKKAGMATMEQDLLMLYKKEIISRDTALDYSNSRKVMARLLNC